ncbi:zinc ribbon domain-containing protein [Halorubrum sp. BOL3-1]|uniref:zinc ribbon domain-containing protein n=1 Tax=Halorubrum sp. BOL3-1 TaxID=2497325 RepID=UPI001004E3DE|nr:zinc ribbon domain-containing protein [Halorubrum sp. BOL3-1]QAU12054.1 zinc ribbon domain-containing protein [Halorubrum sp. BOL3-1]
MPSETSDPDGPPAACPACGDAVPAGASFCPDCGADLGDPVDPAYCPECGEAFDDDDRFCSNCGASRSGGGATAVASDRPRARSGRSSGTDSSRSAASVPLPGESSRAFRRRVQDHLDAGWEIKRDDGDRVVLIDRGIGSVGVHVLLFVFTSGIGNLLYGWWHYSKLAERRRLVRGDETPARAPSSHESAERVETVSAYLLTALLLLIGGFVAFFGTVSGSPAVGLIALAFAGLGLGVAPPVRSRLDRRHGVTAFGRQKTVDHRIARPPETVDDTCVVCGEAFERGLVRRRRDETVVAGVPVRTHSIRRNHYCADCARSEVFGGDDVGELSPDELVDDGEPDGDSAGGDVSDDGLFDGGATDDDETLDDDAAEEPTGASVREASDSTD